MKKKLYSIAFLLFGLIATTAQTKEFITISGKIKSYNTQSGYACFFVDPAMVKNGATAGLGNKAGKACYDSKLGAGIPINFDGLPIEGDYTSVPPADVLIIVKGRWKTAPYPNHGTVYTLRATEWEPFF